MTHATRIVINKKLMWKAAVLGRYESSRILQYFKMASQKLQLMDPGETENSRERERESTNL